MSSGRSIFSSKRQVGRRYFSAESLAKLSPQQETLEVRDVAPLPLN